MGRAASSSQGEIRCLRKWPNALLTTAKPAMATMLYALEVPPAGGDTLFANLYLAYDALSNGMKQMLAEVKTYSVGDRFKTAGGKSRKDDYKGTSAMAGQVRTPGDLQTESEHPLIRTHPKPDPRQSGFTRARLKQPPDTMQRKHKLFARYC